MDGQVTRHDFVVPTIGRLVGGVLRKNTFFPDHLT